MGVAAVVARAGAGPGAGCCRCRPLTRKSAAGALVSYTTHAWPPPPGGIRSVRRRRSARSAVPCSRPGCRVRLGCRWGGRQLPGTVRQYLPWEALGGGVVACCTRLWASASAGSLLTSGPGGRRHGALMGGQARPAARQHRRWDGVVQRSPRGVHGSVAEAGGAVLGNAGVNLPDILWTSALAHPYRMQSPVWGA